jgi:hypothetical protein
MCDVTATADWTLARLAIVGDVNGWRVIDADDLVAGDFATSVVLFVGWREVTLAFGADLFFVSGALLGRETRAEETVVVLFAVDSLGDVDDDWFALTGVVVLVELLSGAVTGPDEDDLDDVFAAVAPEDDVTAWQILTSLLEDAAAPVEGVKLTAGRRTASFEAEARDPDMFDELWRQRHAEL